MEVMIGSEDQPDQSTPPLTPQLLAPEPKSGGRVSATLHPRTRMDTRSADTAILELPRLLPRTPNPFSQATPFYRQPPGNARARFLSLRC